jgi:hypothetical protein
VATENERDRLRSALVALVGVDGLDDLEQMEGVMWLMPAPAQDKAAMIDAIHALMATLPAQEMGEPPSINAVDPVDGIVAPGPTRA